ncbi:hypothetical protein GXW78_17470 [Roseomonas terrae]|uniref:J domain-containing protein n=1 Tax=Neoroseomonas terrae TaxID=424799 RepID=A0ABS5EKC5_9PROT|nr:hypothetical protein [Neoroseomonas terrae]MBR0651464.1 hypothetical protein [Neoroseomonas terrae]
MATAAHDIARRSIGNWPSSRLLDFAEEHAGDRELLELIHGELMRRDVAIAASAARRVAQLLGHGARDADATGGASEESRAQLAAMKSKLDQTERRMREAEARASAAERALATEALPSRGGTLLRRVHLSETAPTWLVDAAQRAFRLRFHPDRFADPEMKARAEETFKEAEDVFRQIAVNGH